MSRYKEEGEIRGLYLHSRREEKQRIIFIIDKSDHGWWSHRRNAICVRQKTLFSSIFFSVVRKVLRFILSIARALKENHNSLGKNTRKKKERYENKKALKGLSSIHAPLKGPAAPARCSPTNGFLNPRGMSDIFVLVLVVLIDACEKSALFICDVLYLFFVCLFCLSFSFQNWSMSLCLVSLVSLSVCFDDPITTSNAITVTRL